MAEDRVRALVLTPDMLAAIRDARAEGASIGPNAVDALLSRHDELKCALHFLIGIQRSEGAIPENIWERARRILDQETGDDRQDPDPEVQ